MLRSRALTRSNIFNARNSTKSMIGGKDSGVIPLSQKPPHYTKTYPTFMPPVYDWWFLTIIRGGGAVAGNAVNKT